MNKLKVYKFIVNRKKQMTPSPDTRCRVGGVTLEVYPMLFLFHVSVLETCLDDVYVLRE